MSMPFHSHGSKSQDAKSVLVPSIDDVTIEDDTNFFDICGKHQTLLWWYTMILFLSVCFFNETSQKSRPAGFGFIEPANGSEDLFAHQRQYTGGDQNTIQDGMKVGETAGNRREQPWPSWVRWFTYNGELSIVMLNPQRANGNIDSPLRWQQRRDNMGGRDYG